MPWALALYPDCMDTSVPSAHQASADMSTAPILPDARRLYLTTQQPIAAETLG